MIKLYAYALLMLAGFDIKEDYEKALHSRFIDSPQDETLLELEFISDDIDSTVSFIKDSIDFTALDYTQLAKEIVSLLKICYEKLTFEDFISKTYPLWQILPEELAHDEPLYELCFADDPLSYGVAVQSQQIVDDILIFFDEN